MQVPQQPEGNGTDCGIYMLRNIMEIVLDTTVEVVILGQNSQYIVSVHLFLINYLITLLYFYKLIEVNLIIC